MNFTGLIFLIAAHYISGKGLLKLFNVNLSPIALNCLSLIIGVPLISFAPCILQLLHVPITLASVSVAITIMFFAFSIPLLRNFKLPVFHRINMPKSYEWAALIICFSLMFYSVWRCFYFPPLSRDALTGPELIAEFTIREKTMINSVFNVDLTTTNNYYKSPYVTSLQIIYKLLVCPFGQLWLSVIFVCFTIWLYDLLKERIHPILAGVLLILFMTIAEMFAYTFLILYDYSNTVFFFLGFYFLMKYFKSGYFRELMLSAFLFGVATYIRTETLVLVVMVLPLVFIHFRTKYMSGVMIIKQLSLFMVAPVAFYFLCMHVFVALFIPIPFDFSSQLNPDLNNFAFFFERLKEINTRLIFSEYALGLWGYFIYIFLVFLAIDIIWKRRFNLEARTALYGIALVYLGLGLLGYLIPHVDLMNTTKRGLFKALPLMLLYLANSNSLLTISEYLKKLEYKPTKDNDVIIN